MHEVGQIDAKLKAGESLSQKDIDILISTENLVGVGSAADIVRRQRHDDRVTFVRVQEIVVEEVKALPIEISPAAGLIRIIGRSANWECHVESVKTCVSAAGKIPVTAFSLHLLIELASSDSNKLAELLSELKDAGLSSIAEACIDQINDSKWFDVVRETGLTIERLAVGDLDNHGGVDILRRIVDLGESLNYVHAFAPLSRNPRNQPTTGYLDLRQVALARIVVDNIESIQIDWKLYGPKLAQVALMFGANDVDSVSAFDTEDLGRRRMPVVEIERNISAVGLVPCQRNGRFERLMI